MTDSRDVVAKLSDAALDCAAAIGALASRRTRWQHVFMIEVKAETGVIRLAFPTTGLSPEQVDDFVTWLRVESVARRSRLLAQDAWRLSEEIKADWWARNQARFGD